MKKKPYRISLLSAFLIPFTLLLVATAIQVGYISYNSGLKSVNDTSNGLRQELMARITEHLESLLDEPVKLIESAAAVISKGSINPGDPQALVQYFRDQLNIYPSVSSFYFGNSNGGLADSGRGDQNTPDYILLTDGFTKGTLRKYVRDEHGNYQNELYSVDGFDATTRPWYTSAVGNQAASWSPVYILSTGQDMAIAASHAVYDSQQELIGVVSVDIFLSQLSRFLADMTIGKTGEAFILERNGLLVAAKNETVFVDSQEGKYKRMHGNESSSPLLTSALEHLSRNNISLVRLNSDHPIEFQKDNKKYYLEISPIKISRELDWIILLVIPEEDFLAGMHASNRFSGLLILFSLVISMCISFLIARKINLPIRELTEATKDIIYNQTLEKMPKQCPIEEIDELIGSFNWMSGKLKKAIEELRIENEEHRETAAKLHVNEEKLQVQYQNIPLPTLTWQHVNDEFLLVNCNEAAREMTNGTVDKFLGSSSKQIFAGKPELCVILQNCFSQRGTIEKEIFYKFVSTKMEKLFNIKAAYCPPDQVMVHAEDITQRHWMEESLRESERKFEALFLSSIAAIFYGAQDGRIFAANASACEMLGKTEEEIIAGGRDAVVNIHDPSLTEVLRERKEKGRFKGELSFKKADGTVFPVEISTCVFNDYYGNERTFTFAQDISERKRSEAMIAAALKEKEVLLKEIHHRVKNNMQIISSLLSLQANTIDDEKSLSIFTDAQVRVQSIALVHEILYESHELDEINLQSYLQKLTQHLLQVFTLDSIQPRIHIDTAGVILKKDHAVSCGLILTELLTNSIKYGLSINGTSLIEIKARYVKNDRILMIFSDNGTGMPQGIDLCNSETLGVRLVTELIADQLEGTWKLNLESGTKWIIEWPQ